MNPAIIARLHPDAYSLYLSRHAAFAHKETAELVDMYKNVYPLSYVHHACSQEYEQAHFDISMVVLLRSICIERYKETKCADRGHMIFYLYMVQEMEHLLSWGAYAQPHPFRIGNVRLINEFVDVYGPIVPAHVYPIYSH